MKIAFISYEYPPDTAYGGIATYVAQAAQMLLDRGHTVEVFCSSPRRSGSELDNGVIVHRVNEPDLLQFATCIAPILAARHADIGFDVLEAPEYLAEAREAIRLVPDIPLVLKLHTGSLLLLKLNYYDPAIWKQPLFFALSLKRGISFSWGYAPTITTSHMRAMDIMERSHALEADEIAAPSKSIAEQMINLWKLDPSYFSHVPYPYTAKPEYLKIPVENNSGIVTFIGRLEIRKGVLDLARAIPTILRYHPNIKFRFVGASEDSPINGLTMKQYLEQVLKLYKSAIEFTDAVSMNQIPKLLMEAMICVFPSLWENFPCVCLEAMAAGRAIVGSSAGGMSEMLDEGRVGKLVPPRQPKRLANAILELLDNPDLRLQLGYAARNRLLSEYNVDRICTLQENSYKKAIEHRNALGTRKF